MSTLQEQRAGTLLEAAELITKAKSSGFDLSDADRAKARSLHAKLDELDTKIAKDNHLAGIFSSGPGPRTEAGPSFTAGTSAAGNVLAIGDALTDVVVGKMTSPQGKAITEYVGPVPVVEGPIAMGRPPTTLLDLIPTVTRAAPVYQFIRQTARTMNAAVVLPGALKPESDLTVASEEASLEVLAHVTGRIDKYLIQDQQNLATFVRDELIAGLRDALEAYILASVTASTGTTAVAAGADPLSTLAAAQSALEALGVVASAFAVSPADWQTMTTTRNASGAFDFGGPIDPATRQVWGVPTAVSHQLAEGQALGLGEGAVILSTDGQVRVDWSDSVGDSFQRNQVMARGEVRAHTDLIRPWAVAEIDLGTGVV